MKSFKLQSAMEYLMTYGWAILIIAVVLGALFSLGIFSSGSLLGTACVAGPGFFCQSPVLAGPGATAGNLSMTLGQSTGSTFYNVGLGCAATSTTNGLPNPTGTGAAGSPAALVDLSAAGAATATVSNVNNAGSLTLSSGSTVSVTGLKCFGTTGVVFANTANPASIGTAFSGSLWMNYTLSSSAPSAGNPLLTQKVATITLKVS
ncbi:MAG: hypothetical protein KGH59_01550 [Candidatus Micrarchaeota archaeon]|nr:hypothetical protein [Candidatus Micrarchaeota archaeon]MDE1804449.1 hypothetical protein [Candidatus Micrarchaeota archaeon]MDE1847077.1 hypothetical protein [Candidatus Micrarchaeota archaeon]